MAERNKIKELLDLIYNKEHVLVDGDKFQKLVNEIQQDYDDYEQLKEDYDIMMFKYGDYSYLKEKMIKQEKTIAIVKSKGLNIVWLKNTKNVKEYNELVKKSNGVASLKKDEYLVLKETFVDKKVIIDGISYTLLKKLYDPFNKCYLYHVNETEVVFSDLDNDIKEEPYDSN